MHLPSTGVHFSMDTRRPVDLADTWIADDAEWTYLDAEAERVADAGGVKVATSCVHTGGREPGRRMRNKIRALLPSMTDPLVVDFTGVEHASSSFLDELLGRLADELGADVFERRVRIVGLAPKLRNMANNVIGQRLEGT